LDGAEISGNYKQGLFANTPPISFVERGITKISMIVLAVCKELSQAKCIKHTCPKLKLPDKAKV
jgi:hypothetical protein